MSAYCQKLVANVVVNGKILREQGGTVLLPFGCEYSISLKNLESRKAAVSIDIDGTDVLGGRCILVEPNKQINIERFILDNLAEGPKFRFIQKTQKISNHCGDKVDYGIIRIEYTFEKMTPQTVDIHHHHDYWRPYYIPRVDPYLRPEPTWASISAVKLGPSGSEHFAGASKSACFGFSSDTNLRNTLRSCTPAKEEGITVPGAISNQSFGHGNIGELETCSYTIVFCLRGNSEETPITKPIFTRTKLTCPTCGTKNRSDAKYCKECGTNLLV